MSNKVEIELTELVPEFPNKPRREIARDSYIRWISSEFGPDCQKQLIAGGPLTGKTNFIAQFASYYENRVISYFINANPLTQDLRTFLYVICNQIYHLLGKPNLPESISLDELKNSFPGLSINLANDAKRKNIQYYFAIDGLEWGAVGDKGTRIIDYPLVSFVKSPYVLCSCRLDLIDKLSFEGFKIRDDASHFLEFNFSDTQEVLAEFNLSSDSISVIHQKAKGLPGYIKIIQDTIGSGGTDWIVSKDLPNDLENLIKKQLSAIYCSSSNDVLRAIETIAVSPKPISTLFLSNMLDINEKQLVESLIKTGICLQDKENKTIQISPEYTRDTLLSKISSKKSKLAIEILEYAKSTPDDDGLLTTLLLREAKDYPGILSKLSNDKMVSTFEKSNGANLAMKQMNIASQMAYEAGDVSEMVRWELNLKTIKLATHYTADSREISALIAIGDSQAALRKAYTLPDSISKVRLLARAYITMKNKNERIPKDALDELKLIIDNQKLDEYERDELRELSIDLFPVLPDKAIEILESNFSKDEKRNSLEVAVTTSLSTPKEIISTKSSKTESSKLSYLQKLYSNWLENLSFDDLVRDIASLENVRAKEYMIREWCGQNRENPELHKGIQLWIDSVVADTSYTISLRSLRKISSSLKKVEMKFQEKLIYKLEIPTFYSLRTPWEEWIGFHLNVAEILYNHNKTLAKQRIDNIHETINLEINDLDIKVFCYARLWGTVSRYYPEIEQSIKLNFERVLSDLLHDSALHDEILDKTLQIIAPIDINFAIEKAADMNTKSRRQAAYSRILETSLRKNPKLNITNVLNQISNQFDDFEKDTLISNITDKLGQTKIAISEENQSTLLRYVRKISDHSMRAEALSNLVAIWNNEKLIRSEKLVNEIISAWVQENDLKLRMVLGYDIVEKISHNSKDAAKQFLGKVQELYLLPGSALASGELGVVFYFAIDMAINSLSLRDVGNRDGVLDQIQNLINRIPATRIRAELYGQLTARWYTLGYAKEAENVLRDKLLPEINKIDNEFDKNFTVGFCLPVIFKYHKQTAFELSNNLPDNQKNDAWLSTVIWSITEGRLEKSNVNIEHLKRPNDYRNLREFAFEAAQNINHDIDLFLAIGAICRSIEQSIKIQKIDAIQAHSLLQLLDDLSKSKLPDKHNIQHKGYLVITLASINGARSVVYKSVSKKHNLSKVDIRKEWDELDRSARNIPNSADRVFVMQYVAKEMFKNNEAKAVKLLEDADSQINTIPAIIDRSDRLEEVGKVWGIMGKKDLARYALEKMSTLVEQMNDFSRDRKLETLTQAAYEFSPEYAEFLVERYDSRYPDKILNPIRTQNEIQKFINSPERILKIYKDLDENPQLRIALASSAGKLYKDLVLGHGRIPPNNVLVEWVKLGGQLDEFGSLKIIQWVHECLISQPATPELTPIFIELASLIIKISAKVSPIRNEGVPEDIANILPGLSSKIFVFRVGEFEKAKAWISDWIRRYAKNYIKLVDPYFGLEQLIFFSEAPKDCKILIVTTDKFFKDNLSQDKIKSQIEYAWKQYSKGDVPQISLTIVPQSQEESFHDRVLITKERGLDIGQSLNGIGNKVGKITDLPYEDAKELESKYADELLNHNSWFLNYDIQPIIVRVG